MRALGIRALPLLAVLLLHGGEARADEPWTSLLAGPRARTRLSSNDARIRRDAAEALGREGAAGPAIHALVTLLPREEDPAVRRAIATALARRGARRAVPQLTEELARKSVEANQLTVAHALGAIGTRAAIRALVGFLEDRDTAAPAASGLARVGSRAVPELIAALHRPGSVANAARLLGAAGDPTATPHLIARLDDERPGVRVAVIRALGELGDRRAEPALLARVGSPSQVEAHAALEALARVGSSAHAAAIKEKLSAPAPLRRAALATLLAIDPKGAVPVLEEAARSGKPTRALEAVEVALEWPRPELVPLLYGVLREGSRAAAAASALAEVPGGAGVTVLIEEVSGPASIHVARALAIAVRKWRDHLSDELRSRAHAALRRATEGEKPVSVRSLVLRALALDRTVTATLVKALGSPDASVRASAAQGLELLGDRDQGPEVKRALFREKDPEAFRRLATAALALGVRVVPGKLLSAMGDARTAPEAMVLAAASLEGAPHRSARRLRTLLRRELRATAPRVRAAAARALAEAGDRQAFRALLHTLDDDALEVRRAAARALEVLRVAKARPAIEARFRVEPDDELREALLDAAHATERRPLRRFAAGGSEVLRVRIAASTETKGAGVAADVVLPDGRWLRMRTLETGEIFMADLPSAHADVRVRVE